MPRSVSILKTIWLTSIAMSSVGMPRIAIPPPWAMFEIASRSGFAPHPEADRIGAEMTATGKTVTAPPADDVAFAAHDLARVEVVDVRADLDDLTDELVADDERRMDRPGRPWIPRLDVEVRAADTGLADANE